MTLGRPRVVGEAGGRGAACDAPRMWLKIGVPLLAVAYVGYRAAVALEIARAKRRGDAARVDHLRAHGFGLYRWLLGGALVLMFLLTLFVVLEAR